MSHFLKLQLREMLQIQKPLFPGSVPIFVNENIGFFLAIKNFLKLKFTAVFKSTKYSDLFSCKIAT